MKWVTRHHARVNRIAVLPAARAHPGFNDEMLVAPGGPDVMLVTCWESREAAEARRNASVHDSQDGSTPDIRDREVHAVGTRIDGH